jgi:hypothetical protein
MKIQALVLYTFSLSTALIQLPGCTEEWVAVRLLVKFKGKLETSVRKSGECNNIV